MNLVDKVLDKLARKDIYLCKRVPHDVLYGDSSPDYEPVKDARELIDEAIEQIRLEESNARRQSTESGSGPGGVAGSHEGGCRCTASIACDFCYGKPTSYD